MDEPRHRCGIGVAHRLKDQVAVPWEIEPNKSSETHVFMVDGGVFRKRKPRRFNSLVYEAFGTLFMSNLLREYAQLVGNPSVSFFSPEAIEFEYGVAGRSDSLDSTLYEVVCPGVPLNRLKNARAKEYVVGGEWVRVEDRVMYTAGGLYEILQREGVVHGDPNLRHLFLLPREGWVPYVTSDNQRVMMPSVNGLAVIDCEKIRRESAGGEGVVADGEEFMAQVFAKFAVSPRAQEYFDQGRGSIPVGAPRFADNAYQNALMTFAERFTPIRSVDMGSMGIQYR